MTIIERAENRVGSNVKTQAMFISGRIQEQSYLMGNKIKPEKLTNKSLYQLSDIFYNLLKECTK